MEMEPTKPPVIGKKLWKIVRIVFFMIKAGISKKSKIMVDLNLLLKRGNKLAEKAIASLIFHHHHHHHSSSSSSLFGCRSNDAFISPIEYEFSCSNSPAFTYPFYPHKRNKHHHHHHLHRFLNSNKAAAKSYYYDDVATVHEAVQRVILEMLNNDNHHHQYQQQHAAVEAPSPLITLPGFGRSPLVRQLRITDSPFPLKDDDGDSQVDKAAEEFIMKFYKDLKLQKSMAALESPYRF